MKNKRRQTFGILLTVVLFSGSIPISFGDVTELKDESIVNIILSDNSKLDYSLTESQWPKTTLDTPSQVRLGEPFDVTFT